MKSQINLCPLKKATSILPVIYRLAAMMMAFAFVFPGCTQKPETVIRAYEQAHNRHDVEGGLSHYSDDIVFKIEGVWTKTGRDEIRGLEVWDSTLNSQLHFEIKSIRGDTVFCKVTENNDWFDAFGIGQVVHNPVLLVLENGKIKNISVTHSGLANQKIGAAVKSIYTWSQQTGDTTINELIKNGEFVYSKEAALKWLSLLKKKSSSEQVIPHD